MARKPIQKLPEKEIKRAAGYIRVSSKKQTEGESLSIQEAKIKEYCDNSERRWQLDKKQHLFRDEGISGVKQDREGLLSLMEAAARNEFDVVVVRDISRFGRSARDLLNNIEKLKENGVAFASVKEGVDPNTSLGKFVLLLLAGLAEMERETIMARTGENRDSLMLQRRIYPGHLPYGYMRKPKAHKEDLQEIIKHPDEEPIFTKVVHFYMNEKMGMEDIVIKLNDLGIKPRIAEFWNSQSVAEMLRNPAHWTGKLPVTVDGQTVIFECPPYLTENEWKDIEKRRLNRKQRVGRKPNKAPDFLLDGLLRCGFCVDREDKTGRSGRMSCWTDKKGDRYYRCYWSAVTKKTLAANQREERCHLPLLPAPWVEKTVIQNLYMFLFWEPEERIIPATEDKTVLEKKEVREEIKRKSAELREAKKVLDKAAEVLFSKNDLNAASSAYLQQRLNEAATNKARLEAELTSAQQRLGKLRKKEQEEQSLIDFKTNRREAYLKIRSILRDLPDEKKRELVQKMLRDDRIVITPPFTEDADGKVTVPKMPRGMGHLRYSPEDIEADWRFNLPILQDIFQNELNREVGTETKGTKTVNSQPGAVNAGGGIG